MATRTAVLCRHVSCMAPPSGPGEAAACASRGAFAAVAVHYEKYLTQTSLARQPSPIRALMPIAALPGMISLGAGNPNPDAFPFEKATITLKGGGTVDLDPELMKEALQYGPTPGIPAFSKWARELQQREHAPPRPAADWDIAFTTGSQDAISKTCDMLINRGDSVLVEEPCYPGAIAVMIPLGAHLVGLRTDVGGLIPESLDEAMRNFERNHPGKRRPRVLYTIPTGHNPSGATISEDRRRAIYALARQYELLILEDDPYYFLSLDGKTTAQGVRKPPPSFLSMDVDGRVMRFDSLSKVLSSGFRIGFATGPKPLIERLVLHMQTSALCTSGMSQACVMALLRRWGEDGWEDHVSQVQALYRRRRDHFIACAERHLHGLAEWGKPEAGMFVWFKLLGVEDSKALIEGPAREEKVLLVPGQYFSSNPSAPSAYVRAAFSTASDQDVDEALRRLAVLLRKQRGLA